MGEQVVEDADVPDGDGVFTQPQAVQGVHGQQDGLGVGLGSLGANQLHAALRELTIAAARRSLVAKNGTGAKDLERQARRGVGDEGANDGGGQLGPEAELPAAQVGEGIELGDDLKARLAQMELGQLQRRHVDAPVAIELEGFL